VDTCLGEDVLHFKSSSGCQFFGQLLLLLPRGFDRVPKGAMRGGRGVVCNISCRTRGTGQGYWESGKCSIIAYWHSFAWIFHVSGGHPVCVSRAVQQLFLRFERLPALSCCSGIHDLSSLKVRYLEPAVQSNSEFSFLFKLT
jgi:hypothetical protein